MVMKIKHIYFYKEHKTSCQISMDETATSFRRGNDREKRQSEQENRTFGVREIVSKICQSKECLGKILLVYYPCIIDNG